MCAMLCSIGKFVERDGTLMQEQRSERVKQ